MFSLAKRKRKGFMKALEGIIAAVLLLGYTASFLSLEPADAEWETIHAKQQAQEYISVVGKTQMSDLILKNKRTEFLDITQYFLGSGKGYSLETENIVDYSIQGAVMLNPAIDTVTRNPSVSASCPSYAEGTCYTLSAPAGTGTLWLVDNNVDGRVEHNAIYRQDTGQGPFYRTDFVPISNGGVAEEWQFGEVRYSGTTPINVIFFNTQKIDEIKNALEADYRISPFSINGRQLDIRIVGALIDDHALHQNDILFLTDRFEVNAVTYPVLANLVRNGVNIVALVSSGTSLTNEFQILTNGKVVNYQEMSATGETEFADVSFESHLFETKRYFSAIGFDINTQGPSQTGEVRLADVSYDVNLTRSVAGGPFDRFNIEGESTSFETGDSFSKSGNIYVVGDIHPDGYFATLKPSEEHVFKTYSFSPQKLVAMNEIEDEFILFDKTGKYAYPVGEPPTMNEGDLHEESDQHFAGVNYAISLAPPSIEYNGTVYPNNGTIQIGPDTFRVYIIDDEIVWWELISRWRIPDAISNHDNKGTIIVLPKPDSDDEWGYFRAATFQLLKGVSEIIRTTYGKKGSSSVTDTFIEARDFYQVYEVIFRVWY